MNIAAEALRGNELHLDVSRDVNETAAIVLAAKRSGGKSAVLILGGGSPKNFILQTEPQIQEVLGIEEKGHDYYLQVTDARPDSGGLSGATPAEAVTWGKVDADGLSDAVVCYLDSTIALPLLTAYALANHPGRPPKNLYERLPGMMQDLEEEAGEGREMKMGMDLEGKRAVVTGSTKGIGLAIAQSLVSEGAKVVISSRHQDDVQDTLESLNPSARDKVSGKVCDVREANQVPRPDSALCGDIWWNRYPGQQRRDRNLSDR